MSRKQHHYELCEVNFSDLNFDSVFEHSVKTIPSRVVLTVFDFYIK